MIVLAPRKSLRKRMKTSPFGGGRYVERPIRVTNSEIKADLV